MANELSQEDRQQLQTSLEAARDRLMKEFRNANGSARGDLAQKVVQVDILAKANQSEIDGATGEDAGAGYIHPPRGWGFPVQPG